MSWTSPTRRQCQLLAAKSGVSANYHATPRAAADAAADAFSRTIADVDVVHSSYECKGSLVTIRVALKSQIIHHRRHYAV